MFIVIFRKILDKIYLLNYQKCGQQLNRKTYHKSESIHNLKGYDEWVVR